MNYLLELENQLKKAFSQAGVDPSCAKVVPSNRPDLCEFQCNGAMAAAKALHEAPIRIAERIVPYLRENEAFSAVSAAAPGFINFNVSAAFLSDFALRMAGSECFGVLRPKKKRIIVDYGGPNVAKPLHIGHLRSAIIGESVKRIQRYMGHEVIGDTHLGDWGLQIGLIIERLREIKPDLPYFDDDYTGEYPKEAPFTISELETIYPEASKKSKEDEAFAARAHENTLLLQNGHRGYRAIWAHIRNVSIQDLKRNYEDLNVHFDLWKAESDAQPYIAPMVQRFKDQGIAYVSNGALVVDVAEEGDKREIPPCLVIKSDGAALYATTDLATIVMRAKENDPDAIIYLADKRQEMHYTQFFRVSGKAGLLKPEAELSFIGFGTMNGKDGKPFKTRDGGVMRLETLISDVKSAVKEKMSARYAGEAIDDEIVRKIALSAIKYGDLSNQAAKDYNFDIDRFTSFEGNTGPYILYMIVRIKSILRKAGIFPEEQTLSCEEALKLPMDFTGIPIEDAPMKALFLTIVRYPTVIQEAASENAPHKICVYLHELSDAFSSFYHETPILKEENEEKKGLYLKLLCFVLALLLSGTELLGIEAPEKM